MQGSTAVLDALNAFYQRFSAHDPQGFADIIGTGPAISVIGTAPGEGHDNRDGWVGAYAEFIADAGLRLEGGASARGWEEGGVGFAVDEPQFVMPDGSYLPTRLTAVFHQEVGTWKVVHMHFSVGVPDEDAVKPPPPPA